MYKRQADGLPNPKRVTGVSKIIFAKGNKISGRWGEWDRKKFSVEDFAAGFVHFENGCSLVLETAWLGHQHEDEDMSCQLFGQNGGIKWPTGEFATVESGNFMQGTITHPHTVENPHTVELKAFYDCIANNTPSPVPWTETEKVIGILEGIYRSQDQCSEITL